MNDNPALALATQQILERTIGSLVIQLSTLTAEKEALIRELALLREKMTQYSPKEDQGGS